MCLSYCFPGEHTTVCYQQAGEEGESWSSERGEAVEEEGAGDLSAGTLAGVSAAATVGCRGEDELP